MERISTESLATCNIRSFENDGLSPEGEASDGDAMEGESTDGEASDGEVRACALFTGVLFLDCLLLFAAVLFLDCCLGLNMRPRRLLADPDDEASTTALELMDKSSPRRKSSRVLEAIMAVVSLLHDI